MSWSILECIGDIPTSRGLHQSTIVDGKLYSYFGWATAENSDKGQVVSNEICTCDLRNK